MKQKEIKTLVNCGNAEDVTFDKSGIIEELQKNGYKTVAISFGVYGMNGGLFQDKKSGKLYAIIGRSTNLFRLA